MTSEPATTVDVDELVREAIASKALVVGPRDQLVFLLEKDTSHEVGLAFAAVIEDTFGPDRAVVAVGPLQIAVIRDVLPDDPDNVTQLSPRPRLVQRHGELDDSEIVDL